MNATPNFDRDSMSEMDRMMGRVRKLLAIAEDSRANPNEAAAAAHQADVIMRKYQIDNADLIMKDMNTAGREAFDSMDVSALMKRETVGKTHLPKKIPSWASWLAVNIAQLHDCQARIVRTAAMGMCLRFSGYKSDVMIAAWTFDYLCGTMIRSCRAWQHEAPRGKDESESYRRGFVLELCRKLREFKQEKEREMQQASSSRALVVVKARAVAEFFGAVSYGTSKANTSRGDAYAQGREAGSKVDVRGQAISNGAAGAPAVRRLK
jgi:hypothetical protein